MVSVELSLKRLNELVGKKLTAEALEDVLVNMGFELDDREGDNLKIDVTTERLDCIISLIDQLLQLVDIGFFKMGEFTHQFG